MSSLPRVPQGLATAAAALGIALLALLLPVRSISQAIFAGSFALALIVFWVFGRLFGRTALGIPRLGPWTSVYLGQFALLAAALPALAINRLAALVLGWSLPLVALVFAGAIAAGVRELRLSRTAPRLDLLALMGLGSVAVVAAIYSSHLSALGLDLHEHVAWTREILARGFVPLDEGNTGILADYPRTFHLMAALWNAAGLGAPAGPFVKSMPFLQDALAVLAVAEQAVELQAARGDGTRRRWEIALALAFYVYAFLLMPLVYPTGDLFGTPRFSSGGLLLLPVVLLAIARAHDSPRATLASLACAPLLLAWALTWNPVVAPMLLLATLPVLVAFWLALGPPRMPGSKTRAAAVGIAGGLAILVLAQDPWVLQTAGQRVASCRRILARAGLLTFDEAVQRGLATPREKSVRNAPANPPCRDTRCALRAAGSAGVDAIRLPWEAARAAAAGLASLPAASRPWLRDAFRDAVPLRFAMLTDYAPLPYAGFVLAGALALLWRRFRRRAAGGTSATPGKILIASLAGLLVAGVGHQFAARFSAALNDGSHESEILAGYLLTAGSFVSLPLLWLPFMGATLVLADPLTLRAGDSQEPRSGRAWAAAGLALCLLLPTLARLNLHRPLQSRGFRSRIGWEDVQALREVEAAIPTEDGVIIPAEHANIAQWEHWVLPAGETAALLPYGERKYLFNVYLGASSPLSWRDLEDRFCSKDPAVRSRFLERMRARWLLVRDPLAQDAAAAAGGPEARMCGGSITALGAVLPAAAQRRGIFLFRLAGGLPP